MPHLDAVPGDGRDVARAIDAPNAVGAAVGDKERGAVGRERDALRHGELGRVADAVRPARVAVAGQRRDRAIGRDRADAVAVLVRDEDRAVARRCDPDRRAERRRRGQPVLAAELARARDRAYLARR